MTTTLPVIALVQSASVDADLIEASLRSAGMRNSFLRFDSADALIATLSEDMLSEEQPGGALQIAVAIVESSAWKLLSSWRDTRLANPLPVIVTFEHDRELREFAQARVDHAAGALKPFTPKTLIRMLEPLRCRWLLMDRDGMEEGA